MKSIEITTDDNIFDSVIRGNISNLISGQLELLRSIGRLTSDNLARSLNMSKNRLLDICQILEIEVE